MCSDLYLLGAVCSDLYLLCAVCSDLYSPGSFRVIPEQRRHERQQLEDDMFHFYSQYADQVSAAPKRSMLHRADQCCTEQISAAPNRSVLHQTGKCFTEQVSASPSRSVVHREGQCFTGQHALSSSAVLHVHRSSSRPVHFQRGQGYILIACISGKCNFRQVNVIPSRSVSCQAGQYQTEQVGIMPSRSVSCQAG